MKEIKEYALYKGEKCLGIGSIRELAEQFNVQEKTIKFYLTPTYKKRVKESKNRKELILIE